MKKATLLLIIALILNALSGIADEGSPQYPSTWKVTPGNYQYSMTVTAVLVFDGIESTDMADKVSAFVGNDCRGVAQPVVYVPSSGRYIAYMMIYSNKASGEDLTLMMYDSDNNKVYEAVNEISFYANASYGFTDDPYIITTNNIPEGINLSANTVNEKESNALIGVFTTVDNDDPDGNFNYNYEFVDGTGSTDNELFIIDGNELRTKGELNYEEKTTRSIRVQTNDNSGGILSKQFTIEIIDVNDLPTELSLSKVTINENKETGFTIGTFTVADEDVSDTHTYSLVSGEGSEDNTYFYLDNNELKNNFVFNFETKQSYSIRARVDDNRGGVIEKAYQIQIVDQNDPPSELTLSNTKIAENQPNLSSIGFFSTEDEDIQSGVETFSYTFVDDKGNNDNSLFLIEGNELKTNASFDYNQQKFYTIIVKVTDRQQASLTRQFVIEVSDANEPPTEITLSSNIISEAAEIGAKVGEFFTEDPDKTDTHTYELVEGIGDSDNSKFTIEENEIFLAEKLDFESQQKYYIRIRTTDPFEEFIEERFIINIDDANDPPTDFQLTSNTINENLPPRTVIGSFSASDIDIADQHIFTLAGNVIDNAYFTIENGVLKSKGSFDFEVKDAYTIKVQVDDRRGGIFIKEFAIQIIDENDPPTYISLTNTAISENMPVGTIIGEFGALDPDTYDFHSFTLFNNAGNTNNNDNFTIYGTQLRTNKKINFEEQELHYIDVKAEDNNGNILTQRFMITVSDVNDSPEALDLSSNQIIENQPIGTFIGNFSTFDQDTDDTHTYSLVSGNGDSNNASFSIDDNKLVTAQIFNVEAKTTYSILVRVTDEQDGAYQKQFTIIVENTNDMPVNMTLSSTSIAENQPIGTLIGEFITTDPDDPTLEFHTYTLINGDVADDNTLFTIEDNKLRSAKTFDFEDRTSYTIMVETDDSKGGKFSRIFTILITNENDSPYALQLSNNLIDENIPKGSVIGIFSTSDQDDGDSHSYEMFNDGSNLDNQYFVIDGNYLKTAFELDFEEKVFYNLLIKTIDQTGASFNRKFTLTVNDTNDEPEDISLSINQVSENVPIGTMVGKFTATDQDSDDAHSFRLIEGINDDDNDLFAIDGNQIKTNAELNFEEKPTCSVRVEAIDKFGDTFSKSFLIIVEDANDAPYLSNQNFQVYENSAAFSRIGFVKAYDYDQGQSLSYLITANDPNNIFEIDPFTGEITLNHPEYIDFETHDEYQFTITVRDDGKERLTADAEINIQVLDVNEKPDIQDQQFIVNENAVVGTLIGTVVASDVDNGQNISFSFSNAQADYVEHPFVIEPYTGEILVGDAAMLDFESHKDYLLKVVATDDGAGFLSDTAIISITVNDAIENKLNATNYISPNNDGYNDYWIIQSPELYFDYKLLIFNSAGEIVFETTGYQNDWNGTSDDKELPVDVYYYLLRSPDGKFTFKGTITLMK